MLMRCQCQSEQQDKLHTPGVRVFNEKISKTRGVREFRCTVCAREIKIGNAKEN